MHDNDDYDRKSLEMSRYISIDQYDRYEQDHPFYREMVEKMISIFYQHCQQLVNGGRREATHEWSALEFGAGTGLFTERIAAQPFVKVTAVEVDTICFDKLSNNMKVFNNVLCLEQDSRYYSGSGTNEKYDFVFSCFADHHIHDPYKLDYLKNVKKNLKEDGLFIVGEELLPYYPETNETARNEAIRKYHGHILYLIDKIDLEPARKALLELESQAMESGLARVGDFKVSAEVYNSLFLQAGLASEQIKIGPLDRDDLGGVYVIVGHPYTL
jgi:SAM-dependent methyltransferase